MSADEFASLDVLVQRLRNQLWRQRIKRGAAYGLASSGLFLLLAGATALLLLPVPVGVWLPLAVAPPLLGAALAFFWQRPGGASVVALFDRHGAYAELLVSGWEAYNTAARQRSAGAVAVLRAATATAANIVVPANWASQQLRLQWLPLYTAAVWVLILTGAFALQLPPQATAKPPVASVAAAKREAVAAVSLSAARKSVTSPGEQLPTPDPAAGAENAGVTDALATTPQAQGEAPAQLVALEEISASTVMAAADEDSSQLSSEPVATGGDGPAGGMAGAAAGISTDGASGNAGEEALRGQPDEPFELPVRYAEIARQIAAQVNHTIAGSGSVAVTETGATDSAQGLAPRPELGLQLTAVPYTTRFSPSQRAQINAYFEYLDTLP